MSDGWTAGRIPDQSGRVAVVTGANSGLGLITARELARAGASVVLACRNTDKGAAALRELTAGAPGAGAELAAWAGSTSTISMANAATGAGGPTGSRSSPTCCSRSSWIGVCVRQARP